ncbi:hypothetical protein JW960_10245 [candidate division KSB1 bacterium]|nr:hypothetical protein [candidate division KSB1 bacterium]
MIENDRIAVVHRSADTFLKTIRNFAELRGIIKVDTVQDFDAIRKYVREQVSKHIADEKAV